jgi:hypothetical protein
MIGRICVLLVALAALIAATPLAAPARAAWGSYVLVGKALLESDPSCASESPGAVFCAAVGPGGKLMFARYIAFTWTGWTSAAETVTSAPSCSSASLGNVVCAARNASLEMITYFDASGTVSSGVVAPVIIGSAPGCAPVSTSGGVLCAARSPSGALVAALYNGNSTFSSADWSIIQAVASTVYSPVNCALAGDLAGDLICAWLTKGSAVATRVFSAGTATWAPEGDIGGTATNPPICTASGLNIYIGCFATGTNSALFGNLFGPGPIKGIPAWGGWGSFAGLVHGYSCVDDDATATSVTFACGVTGLIDSGFWTNEYNGSSWSGWVQQGTTTFIGAPSCLVLNSKVSPVQVMCVITKQNGMAVSITGP